MLHAAALMLLTTVVLSIPTGLTIFFDSNSCPPGWRELNAAQGRLVVSVADPKNTGVTVNSPLSDREDRVHAHAFQATVSVPQRSIAAISCCNNQGAHNGDYPVSNNTVTAHSNYPFTQVLLCTFQGTDDGAPLAYGSIGYFDPDVADCPKGWAPIQEANGRLLVPGYERGGAIPNDAAPLASGEDRVHSHSINISFPTNEVSYAGAEGCCNGGPANYQNLLVATQAYTASTGLPYIQLLTCTSQTPTFNQTLPVDALVFNSLSCPPGWQVENDVSGRMMVGLPAGGSPGASFGGNSLPGNGTADPAHLHKVSGSLALPSTGVGLASGCCGGGYLGAGTYGYQGTTSDVSDELPYLLVPLCRSISSTKKYFKRAA